MTLIGLAWKSLRHRAFATGLTVLSISLSVSLLLSVEKVRDAVEQGFTQSISQVDLVVGARSGPIQLMLYSVFNIGSVSNNVSYESYQHWKNHPAVEWTIPYSLGDGHRGFRVIGTTADFFKFYRFRGGEQPRFQSGQPIFGLWDVVIGSDVAQSLNYRLGDSIVVAHGVTRGEAILQHGDKPFQVVGVLQATGTPIDRALYISLEAMEALHLDWQTGAAPSKANAIPADKIRADQIHIGAITSFFLRTKSRLETLRLQREINEYREEPLLAVIPGLTLAELWNSLSYVEQTLKLISMMVVLVGFFAMLIALLTTLSERRREMAILRSLGAGVRDIFFLFIFESFILSGIGVLLGTVVVLLLRALLGPWLASTVGLYFTGWWLPPRELAYLALIWIAGTMIGVVPALKAIKQSLKDGLTLKI